MKYWLAIAIGFTAGAAILYQVVRRGVYVGMLDAEYSFRRRGLESTPLSRHCEYSNQQG